MARGIAFTAVALAGLTMLVAAEGASAASFKVTTTLDEFGGPGGTGCALREAVQAANADHRFGGCKRKGSGNADTIKLQGGSSYQDGRAGEDDNNENGDLDFEGKTELRVLGAGRATLDGNNVDRLIDVLEGAKLVASRLIVQEGSVPTPGGINSGGGIRTQGKLVLRSSAVNSNQVPNDLNTAGGAIAAVGDAKKTKLERVVVSGNVAQMAYGGALYVSDGELAINRSWIFANVASVGGGLSLISEDPVRITNSTISGNHASGEQAGGGGMYVTSGLTATNVTITGNTSNTRGGGIYDPVGTAELNAVTLTNNTADLNGDGAGTLGGSGGGITGNAKFRNSIIAGNAATNAADADCAKATNATRSLVGMGTGCPEGGTNVATLDPKLMMLGENGGPTPTHELLADSEAIGLAGKRSAPKLDQRGVKRDKNPDSGAYER